MHAPISFNTLWPRHAIWRHRSGPTLAQVMACCLMAPSHYLTQCWLIINKSSDHQLKAISQEIPQPSITKVSLKITYITIHANLPGANELNHVSKRGPRSEWISGFIHTTQVKYPADNTLSPQLWTGLFIQHHWPWSLQCLGYSFCELA